MKKSYSSWNLLQERLSGYTGGFFKSFASTKKSIIVTMPYYDFLRGKVFIDDLFDAFGDQIPQDFDFAYLLYMLYQDLLQQIKKGGGSNEQLANYIRSGHQRYFKKRTKQKRVMKALTSHLFEFETVEEEEEEEQPKEGRTAYIELKMREKELLRGEVLLHDLSPYMDEEIITIEQLISIVYLDFIQKIKADGNSVKVQKSIVAHLKNA